MRVTGFDGDANPTMETPRTVTLMLQSSEKIIDHKVGLLNLAKELGNVSEACQIMGPSRDTFYRYSDAAEDGGVEALLKRPRRPPDFKNRVNLETEPAVATDVVEYSAHGQVRVQRVAHGSCSDRQCDDSGCDDLTYVH